MTAPQVVRVPGASPVRVVQVTAAPSAGGGARSLDELSDVEGATAALPGQVLAKTADGSWRPTTLAAGSGPQSYLHEQASPSTVWLITHGLGFAPAGVEVFDHLGARHHPVLTYPSPGVVRLDFLTPVRGTARLS